MPKRRQPKVPARAQFLVRLPEPLLDALHEMAADESERRGRIVSANQIANEAISAYTAETTKREGE